MKKILILLSIIIFIKCDKKSYEKLKINEPKKLNNPFKCARVCPEGKILRMPCDCVPICENGYYPNGRCKPKKNNTTTEVKKCSPGYYYSKQYKRCCKVGIKGGPCGPKKPKSIEFIDN